MPPADLKFNDLSPSQRALLRVTAAAPLVIEDGKGGYTYVGKGRWSTAKKLEEHHLGWYEDGCFHITRPGYELAGMTPPDQRPERLYPSVKGLAEAVAWLDSEQDPDAYVSQFGVSKIYGDFEIQVTPHGPASNNFNPPPAGGSVIVFDLIASAQRKVATSRHMYEVVNGIERAERDKLQALLAEVVPVHSAWNGNGIQLTSCSFHVAKDTGPGVARAYSNYHKKYDGFPDDKRPFVTGIDPTQEES